MKVKILSIFILLAFVSFLILESSNSILFAENTKKLELIIEESKIQSTADDSKIEFFSNFIKDDESLNIVFSRITFYTSIPNNLLFRPPIFI